MPLTERRAIFNELREGIDGVKNNYDIILMDDPWIPFFAENRHLAKLGTFFDALGVDCPDSDFLGNLVENPNLR